MVGLRSTFGLCVKAHRHRLNLTQQQLADKTDLSLDMIAKLESGAIGASFATIEKLSQVFSTDAASLFRLDATDNRFNPQLNAVVSRLAVLSEHDLIWISAIIDAALKPRSRQTE
ncbi:helix-turn-helix domain-containing protein [Agrobacterium sp. rho-13.3]|uniref:helix-turn-helix domain-containing protein n=1 Tax=Agrobacterium sp. rho-13.3 TaxID=3072980 RepID=UPI002A0FF04B|nr:helix-turn-helix transcriptional regulator [Agrobacterium sp. rho-13.3]MDX8307802.1 helix-turn-helix transcriptional regulator [Agrobacterium sp. rho-13.3]